MATGGSIGTVITLVGRKVDGSIPYLPNHVASGLVLAFWPPCEYLELLTCHATARNKPHEFPLLCVGINVTLT